MTPATQLVRRAKIYPLDSYREAYRQRILLEALREMDSPLTKPEPNHLRGAQWPQERGGLLSLIGGLFAAALCSMVLMLTWRQK